MSLLATLIPVADWHGPGWWIVFFPLGWFVFFFLLFFAFRRLGWWGCGWAGYGSYYGRRGRGGPVDPLELLDRRFAEGDIDAEEYGSRRARLEEGRGR